MKWECEFCAASDPEHAKTCCWAKGIEIIKFRRRALDKYILESLFDMVISMMSVGTDLFAIIMYLERGKWGLAGLTLIPVLLPTFVFTNVYLSDEKEAKVRKKPLSKVTTISEHTTGTLPHEKTWETSSSENGEFLDWETASTGETLETGSTDSNIQELENGRKCTWSNFLYNWSCCSRPIETLVGFWRGCFQCFCNRDLQLRKAGAAAAKNSFQKMVKYGFGTFVLRFIAWAWYVKALIYGVKAFREPKKFMKIEPPINHWSHELLIRLDFLQAALENAPQCCIQIYALISEPDETVWLGLMSLFFSFMDYIRVNLSVQWDMNKGPVPAPTGCYDTYAWKLLNIMSWVFIYVARSCALALVVATTGYNRIEVLFPIAVIVLHLLLFGKILSKAEYGVAAQKLFVATFISLFFLPELDSSVMPAVIQFYYAMLILENAFFILPFEGFDKEYCIGVGGRDRGPTTFKPAIPPEEIPDDNRIPTTTYAPNATVPGIRNDFIVASTTQDPGDCLIDPTIITLAVPTLTIIGAIFRIGASQKMVNFKQSLPTNTNDVQGKMETSIANLFKKNWTQMSVNEMFSKFVRMLKKEVVIPDKNPSAKIKGDKKKLSFMTSRLQADFLASQTFIRESFSLIARTTRSHDVNFPSLAEGKGHDGGSDDDLPPSYNSDSELTIRLNNMKKRPRLPRSRNVSESKENTKVSVVDGITISQVDTPSGPQMLENCWV